MLDLSDEGSYIGNSLSGSDLKLSEHESYFGPIQDSRSEYESYWHGSTVY